MKYDNSNPQNIVEYFIIENFHTRNDYATANPFIIRQLFDQVFTHGILVFHIEEEDLNIPTNSNLDIECADGLWNFYLSAGANTPYDRSDDVLAKHSPSYSTGYDERDVITLTVGPKTWNDYYCLTPSSFGPNPPPNHGRRYHRDASIGDNYDLFKLNYATVFTRWSNPTTNRADVQIINKGFEVKSYNPTLKEYELSVQVNYDGILSLSPSKPQNLKVTANSEQDAVLTWSANIEPDIISGGSYKIYKASTNGEEPTTFGYITSIPAYPGGVACTTWTDVDPAVGSGSKKLFYKISAVDNTNKESIKSDYDWVAWNGDFKKKGFDNFVKEYKNELIGSYPNPFNPTTKIKYAVGSKQNAESGKQFVTLKVYDLLGREIATLVNEPKEAGEYEIEFNADKYGLTSGNYFYQLQRGEFVATKKFVLMK